MFLGEKIRQLRQQNRLTQDQLADLIKTHQYLVSHWEQNYVKPTLYSLKKLARALGVSWTVFASCSLPPDGRSKKRRKKKEE